MTIDPYLIQRAAADFPQGGAPLLTTARLGLQARSAAHAAFVAAQQHLRNLTAVRASHPADVAPELHNELRQSLSQHLSERLAQQFDNPLNGYVRAAERAHEQAAAEADKHRPKYDPESTAQSIRTDQAWNNHIRPMLEAGKEWADIIPTLDQDGLLAVERFAPGYEARIRDRHHQHEVPAALKAIRDASERHLPNVVSEAGRVALREAQDTANALQYVRDVAGWLKDATALNAASVSIGLKRGAHEVGAHRPVDTSPDAQSEYGAALATA